MLLENFLNFLFPNVCGICEKICKQYVCEKCEKKLRENLNITIKKYKTKYFETHIFLFKYDGIIRNKLLDYKFNEKSYLYKFFSEIFVKNEKACRILKTYDIILSVPIHKKRKAERGYNQSELVAKYLAKKLEITFLENTLIKKKNSVPQSTLKKEERLENVINVYYIQKTEALKNKKVILFDDIYTTGATANECAKVLKKAGTEKVLILTIAKD